MENLTCKDIEMLLDKAKRTNGEISYFNLIVYAYALALERAEEQKRVNAKNDIKNKIISLLDKLDPGSQKRVYNVAMRLFCKG